MQSFKKQKGVYNRAKVTIIWFLAHKDFYRVEIYWRDGGKTPKKLVNTWMWYAYGIQFIKYYASVYCQSALFIFWMAQMTMSEIVSNILWMTSNKYVRVRVYVWCRHAFHVISSGHIYFLHWMPNILTTHAHRQQQRW